MHINSGMLSELNIGSGPTRNQESSTQTPQFKPMCGNELIRTLSERQTSLTG